MGHLDQVQLNVFEVVSPPYTDDKISLLHPAIGTMDELSSIEKRVERTTIKIDDLISNLSLGYLLFLHGNCFSMSCKVIFRRNGKKGNKDGSTIRRISSNS